MRAIDRKYLIGAVMVSALLALFLSATPGLAQEYLAQVPSGGGPNAAAMALRPDPAIRPDPAFRPDPARAAGRDPAYRPDPGFTADPAMRPDPAFKPDPGFTSDPGFKPDPAMKPDPGFTN